MRPTKVGIDLGGTKLLVRLERADEVIVERLRTGPEFGPADLSDALHGLLGSPEPRNTSIGIAVPGLVEDNRRVVACDVLPRFVGWSAGELRGLADALWLMNDAEAALVEEARELKDADAVLVMVGTRIGAAVMSAGRILRGACGWAGELGYLPVVQDGSVTTLDRVAPGEALTEHLGLRGDELRERLGAGDPSVRNAVETAGWWLGVGLAAVINLLNPRLIVVGGGTTRLPGYLDAALRSAKESALPELWSCCTIREVRAGEEVVARGAALGPRT